MKKSVGITGITGTVGKVLEAHLSHRYTVIGYKRSDFNLANLAEVLREIRNLDVLVHLAWAREVGFSNELMDVDDLAMVYNMYHAAKINHIPRVIMASSIHADDFTKWKKSAKMNPYSLPLPNSPYGAAKVYMEALGKYYSTKGVEVVCIRLGGVNDDDRVDLPEDGYQKIYLSHKDLVSLVTKIIEAPSIPNNYQLLYAISDNKGRVHDYANVFGWKPTKPTAEDAIRS